MRHEPKAVIFDYGNVLSNPQEFADLEAMAAILDTPVTKFVEVYWRYRIPYDEGKMDARSYWETVGADAHRSVSTEQVEQLVQADVASWTRPRPAMPEFARDLRTAGVKTAVLSNMPFELRKHVTEDLQWLPTFDHMTYSCDVGVCKPEQEIYIYCLDGLRVPAGEALFLDDREANVEGARRLGMQALLFTTAAAAKTAIEESYLLPVTIAGGE